jgi:hypothetical protein
MKIKTQTSPYLTPLPTRNEEEEEDDPADMWWPNWAPGEYHYAPGQPRPSWLWLSHDTTDPWYPAWLDRED